MYRLEMEVGENVAILDYNDFALALQEFKDCVVEVFSKTNETDDYIMKITKDYAIFKVQCKLVMFRVELTKVEEE